MTNKEIQNIYIGADQASKAYLGTDIIWEPSGPVDPYEREYLTVEMLESGNFSINNDVFYSLNNGAWTHAANRIQLAVSTGDEIRFKQDGPGTSGLTYLFSGNTVQHIVYGNIESLEHGDNFFEMTSMVPDTTFTRLFDSDSGLTSAENLVLPAMRINVKAYELMFHACVNLVTPPRILPSTSLTTDCYYEMFSGDSKLVSAPVLPATTLAQSCYQRMFNSCVVLETAPVLPATNLATNCYYGMFQGCNGLFSAPELPATTLAQSCYYDMFKNCKNLYCTPELNAPTLAPFCYRSMFEGCNKLNCIRCKATDISANSCTYFWVANVAATGTFEKATGMEDWTTGNSGIPSGWSVVSR